MPAPDDTRTDVQLIAAMNQGDTSAFDVLYNRHATWAVRVARRFTRDDQAALDAMQDAFCDLLRRFPGFSLSARLTTFLYPVIKHNALAAQRRRPFAPIDDALPLATPFHAPTLAEHNPTLANAVTSLSDPLREVLLMRVVDEMTVPEVATALEIPEGTVKSRLHTALAELRKTPQIRDYFA